MANGVGEAPTGFERPHFRDDAWDDISVPGHWQLQDAGASDPPIYTNTNYPFPNHPPYAPRKNPTGLYRRTFSLPAEWLAPGGEDGVRELDERFLVGEVRIMVCGAHDDVGGSGGGGGVRVASCGAYAVKLSTMFGVRSMSVECVAT